MNEFFCFFSLIQLLFPHTHTLPHAPATLNESTIVLNCSPILRIALALAATAMMNTRLRTAVAEARWYVVVPVRGRMAHV